MNDLMVFKSISMLTPYDAAIATQIRNVVPQKVAGQLTYSSTMVTAPVSTAVLASGLISPSAGIDSTGNAFSFVIQGQFGFTSTGNSISIFWDGTNGSQVFVVRRADGTPITIPADSITLSSLTPLTTYKFAPFVAVAQPQAVSFVIGDSGSPRYAFSPSASATFLAQAAQTQRLTVNERITNGFITFATAATGGTSTGGGNSSPNSPYNGRVSNQ